jgi:2-polyprenyl-3-methyl-5-hydroxy-6-metoxy-1,4-benzoquinol methylase
MTTEITTDEAARRDALVGRLFEAAIGTMEVYSVHLGERLGLYRSFDEGGPATPPALAARASIAPRYAREWLEQQASAGFLDVEDAAADADQRRYSLPASTREVVLDGDSLSYLGGLLRLTGGVTQVAPAVMEAYRTGGGVSYPDFGADTREGIALMNRPMFLNLLGGEWFPAAGEIHGRLQGDEPARVADVGCGTGWSAIAIARAYPRVRVDGFDLDHASIERARANAAEAGVADRVTFQVRDAADPALAGRYDFVTAFETVHDMARPVEALATMRRLLGPGGVLIVADENVGETFAAPGNEIERLNYAFSALHCLPATIAEGGPVEQATGTVMRPPTLRRYAEQAGFAAVEILPIQKDFWRFYRLAA